MNAKKYRWSRMYESAEEELMDFLAAKHIEATRHEIESYDGHDFPAFSSNAHLWAVEGTSVLTINDKTFSLQPGDAFDIPASTPCSIATTVNTFAWYESQDA